MQDDRSERVRRVQGLYEEVIARVIEGLRRDVRAEGLDESVLEELKQVGCNRSPPHAFVCLVSILQRCMCFVHHWCVQRWYEKLQSSGALAGGGAGNLVSTIGGGRALAPPQYAPPPQATHVETSVGKRRGGASEDGGDHVACTLAESAAGLPRGSDLYGSEPVHDGVPDAKIVRVT